MALCRAVTLAEKADREGVVPFEDILRQLLRDVRDVMATEGRDLPIMTTIIACVAQRFGLKPSHVLGAGRSQTVATARAAISQIASVRGLSAGEIAVCLNRTPSGVTGMIERARERMADDTEFARKLLAAEGDLARKETEAA